MNAPKLKIALINATKNDFGFIEPPMGILSLASYLIAKKVVRRQDIMLLDAGLRDPVDFLKYFKPDLVGISAMTASYPEAVRIGKAIKEQFNVPLIIGGIHISVLPEQINPPFDVGVIGEGEETLLELIRLYKTCGSFSQANLSKISGVVYRDTHKKLQVTQKRPMIKTLTNLPPIDWSLMPEEVCFRNEIVKVEGEWRLLKQASIFSARGCPFDCVFCGRHSVFKGVRFFDVKKVVHEIKKLYEEYDIRAIRLLDDTFTLNKARLRIFNKELKKQGLLKKIVFTQVFARADLVDEEFLSLLKTMGVVSLFYGFESGSDKVLSYLKNNTTTVEDNRKAVELTDKIGIGFIGSFMLGSPNETKAEIKKTISFIKWMTQKENCLRVNLGTTTPYPGTDLWKYALQKGRVSEKNVAWHSLKIHLPSGRKTELFFDERISSQNYSLLWQESQDLANLVKKKSQEQKGFKSATNLMQKKARAREILLPFSLTRHEVRQGRILLSLKRLFGKSVKHLFSRDALNKDLAKFKNYFPK